MQLLIRSLALVASVAFTSVDQFLRLAAASSSMSGSNSARGVDRSAGGKALGDEDDTTYCQTEGCREVARNLLQSIDRTVDPCQDFSKFACDGWRSSNAEGNRLEYSQFNKLDDAANEALISQLTSLDQSSSKYPKVFSQAQNFHQLCVDDSDSSNAASKADALSYVRDFAKWPLLNNGAQSAEDFDIAMVAAKIWRDFGASSLVDLNVDVSASKPDSFTLYVNQGKMEHVSRQKYENDVFFPYFKSDYKAKITKAFTNLLTNLQLTTNADGISAAVDSIMQFEGSLIRHIIPLRENLFAAGLTKFETLESVSEKFVSNRFDWTTYFETALDVNTMRQLQLHGGAMIVPESDYLESLMDLLSQTDVEVVGNYLLWRLLIRVSPFLGSDYIDAANFLEDSAHGGRSHSSSEANSEETKSVESGMPETLHSSFVVSSGLAVNKINPVQPSARRDLCVKDVVKTFQPVADCLTAEAMWSDAQQSSATKLATLMKKQIAKVFDDNHWLSPQSKQRMLAKLDSLMVNVGSGSDSPCNFKAIQAKYDSLKLPENAESYFKNFIAVNQFAVRLLLTKLTETPKRTAILDPLGKANGRNVYWQNSVGLPLAYWQKPIFDEGFPSFMNYATAGFIVSHEMFHAFDTFGVMFDDNGKLNPDWLLDEASKAELKQRIFCLTNRFDKMCYALLNMDASHCSDCSRTVRTCLNGTATMIENFADVSGIMTAQRAYRSLLKSREGRAEKHYRLKGLEEYSSEQLFFVSYAFGWCKRLNDVALLDHLADDKHAPEDVRINTVLQNMPEFTRAFRCKAGQSMFSDRRNICELW